VSGEILTPDQIAALVEAAKRGELPDEAAAPGGGSRRGHRLRTVDFSRPTKFTSDHQRRIGRAIDTFCQTCATRLSSEFRHPIELEAINTMQLTWAAAQSQLPAGSLAATIEVQPIATRMLLSIEQPFVLTALDCLLGGVPDRAPRERRLSEIDWVLTRRLFDSIVQSLSVVWQDLGGITLTAGEIEAHHDASQVASVSEPTFVVVIEARINRQSSAITLLVPWVSIHAVGARIAGKERPQPRDGVDEGPGIEWALAGVPVTLRAEVAAVEMPVERILALAPGSVVRLGARADQGVALFAENVKLGRAQPGSNGSRRAVQLRGTERSAA
jgi:flagellar motor switch protein FliM